MKRSFHLPRMSVAFLVKRLNDSGWHSRTRGNNTEQRADSDGPRIPDNDGMQFFRRILVICMDNIRDLPVREPDTWIPFPCLPFAVFVRHQPVISSVNFDPLPTNPHTTPVEQLSPTLSTVDVNASTTVTPKDILDELCDVAKHVVEVDDLVQFARRSFAQIERWYEAKSSVLARP
jgi:hypothetical protein